MCKLFCFEKTLSAALSKEDALKRLCAAFSGDRGLCLSGLTATADTLSFSVKGESVLAYNSFRPDVQMRLTETEEGTDVQIRFQIKRSVRILACVVYILLAAFAAVWLWFLIQGELEPAMLLIPLGMALFSVLMCRFGLRLSSREVISIARNAVR